MMAACPICLNLHERVAAWDFTRALELSGHRSLGADISASADGGCEGCKLIRTILRELAHMDISEGPYKEFGVDIGVLETTIWVAPYEIDNPDSSPIIHLFPGDDRSLFDGKPSKISGDTSSNEAFETARAWLDNCVTNHTQCKTSDELPRRIVDVGESDTEDLPKLIEPCQLQRGKYACLSYCWGNDPEANIRTTKNTLAQRKSGIEWKDIPATITDAILACRKLGIHFLWIDALCIIQDDVQDWALECANMAEIYSNSYITLAAVAAQDPSRGMVKRSLVNQYRSMDFSVRIAGRSRTTRISAREDLDHRLEIAGHVDSDSENWPLIMRAWVLQEMLLSPRVLRFNIHELSWQCSEIMTCECSRIARKSATFLIHQLSSYTRSSSDEQYFYEWRNIVSSFSGRGITYERDRLPAISAIARKFSPVGGRYFAGIWEKDLLRGLMWTYWDSHTAKQLDRSTPSWSWASSQTRVAFACDGPVEDRKEFVLQEQAKVRNIHCILATANEFGSVQGGSVTISGRLIQVLVTCTKGTSENPPVDVICVRKPRPFEDIDTSNDKSMPINDLTKENILSDPNAEMYAFLLASMEKTVLYKTVYFSLLLKKVPSKKYPVAYERLGLLEEDCRHDESDADFRCSLFTGTTEETITIV